MEPPGFKPAPITRCQHRRQWLNLLLHNAGPRQAVVSLVENPKFIKKKIYIESYKKKENFVHKVTVLKSNWKAKSIGLKICSLSSVI